MKIIVPMVGVGQRFLDAGFELPKPLISIDGKPMILRALEMFDKNDEYVFIVNKDHAKSTNLFELLYGFSKNIIVYENEYLKKGPVWEIKQVLDRNPNFLKDNEPVVVSYCDFCVNWNYRNFLEFVRLNDCDGCVVSYKGFHPHLLDRQKLYASMKVDQDGRVVEIREKFSFTENLMECHQSAGSYFFKRGEFLKKYTRELVESGKQVAGEFYVSQLYELMLRDKLRIWPYNVEHFLQWGTPEDMENFIYWLELFKGYEQQTSMVG